MSKIKDKTLDKRMMMFTLKESKPGEPLLLHDEPIYLEDKIIGRTTSGNYSFCFNKNLSFGYVNSGNTKEDLKGKNIYEIFSKVGIVDKKDINICTDLGSGAGLPGIVLGILMKPKKPLFKLIFYEKSFHKSVFLKEMTKKFNLNLKKISYFLV